MSSRESSRGTPLRELILGVWEPIAARPWGESVIAGIGGFTTIFVLAASSAGLGANLLIAPFGASCVLVFAIPQSPLAQPRNVIGGHLISTVAGLSVFCLLGSTPLSFALGVGLAISAMSLTGMLHPPAGADPIVVIFAAASWRYFSSRPCWSERSASSWSALASIAGSRVSPIRWECEACRLPRWIGRPRNDLANAAPVDLRELRHRSLSAGRAVAVDIHIRCVNKTGRTSADDRIHHIGGLNADGSRWRMTEDQAIAGIREGRWRFWTGGGDKKVWIVIAENGEGREYLKTESDGVQPDNLLALPECP
jgi:hypothetical protein